MCESDPYWADAVRLSSLNAEVDAYNNQRLNALATAGTTVHRITAGHGMGKQDRCIRRHIHAKLIPKANDNCGGLRQVLEVRIPADDYFDTDSLTYPLCISKSK